MIYKKLLSTGLLCTLVSSLFANDVPASSPTPAIEIQEVKEEILPLTLPEKFYLSQRWVSWTTTFDVTTDQFTLGTVHRKFLSWTVEYNFYNFKEQLLANARMRFFNFGAIFDIKDGQDRPIGMVNEKIFSFFPTFEIINSEGEILAIAKMNFWGTRYTLKDPVTQEVLAILSRPFFRFKSDWTVDIQHPSLTQHNKIDPAFFIVVMAFQTDLDYWKRKNSNHYKSFITLSSNKNTEVFKTHLETYRPFLKDQEPTEKDFAKIEMLTEDYLLGFESNEDETLPLDPVESLEKDQLCFQQSIDKLFLLLEGESLSLSEKSALFLLIEARLNDLEAHLNK